MRALRMTPDMIDRLIKATVIIAFAADIASCVMGIVCHFTVEEPRWYAMQAFLAFCLFGKVFRRLEIWR